MRIALGSDEATQLTAALEAKLRAMGHEVVPFGALTTDDREWPGVGRRVAEAVADGKVQSGVVCCWTGTGVSIAANKVHGVRAALCNDPDTAEGARKWNDANVLALSLRNTSVPIAEAILERWFATAPSDDPTDRTMVAQLEA